MHAVVVYLSGDKAYSLKFSDDFAPGDLVERPQRAEPIALVATSPEQSERPNPDGFRPDSVRNRKHPVMLS